MIVDDANGGGRHLRVQIDVLFPGHVLLALVDLSDALLKCSPILAFVEQKKPISSDILACSASIDLIEGM